MLHSDAPYYWWLLLSDVSIFCEEFWDVADLTCARIEEELVKLAHGLTLAISI